jgi:fructan beta-fructosidase
MMNDVWRPKLHFTPKSGWINDPVGLVYYGGEYHLFYEYNPYAPKWDKMHWGHAVSKDLYNWEHLPIAIFPDDMGEIYSGSCFFDAKNDSGLGTKENPPLLAFYTSHHTETKREQQCIAYSLDGRNFVKYEGNPVIPGQENTPARDPQVFANPLLGGYAMCITRENEIWFYVSENLLEWKLSGSFAYASNCAMAGIHAGTGAPGAAIQTDCSGSVEAEDRTTHVVTTRELKDIYECPCMLPFETEDGLKWVLMISTITTPAAMYAREVRYFVGEFNGRSFKQTEFPAEMLVTDYGPDFYAATVFANTDKKIMLAWLGNSDYVHDVPTDAEGFRGVLTMPRKLSLVKTEGGYRLKSELVQTEEVSDLGLDDSVGTAEKIGTEEFAGNKDDIFAFTGKVRTGDVLKISCVDKENTAAATGSGEITITVKENEYIIDRTKAGDRSFSASFASQSVLSIPRKSSNSNMPGSADMSESVDESELTVIIDGCVMEVLPGDGLTPATFYIFPSSRSHSLV